MKKILCSGIFCLFLLSISFANEIRIVFDGFQLACDVPPLMIQDRVMVPVRVILEKAGAIVEYDDSIELVRISTKNKIVELTIGSNIAYVNGQKKILDVPARVIDNRTMIPVRFVSENLGLDVLWHNNQQIVEIISAKHEVIKEIPTLKPTSEWYGGDKEGITKITFLDSYTSTGNEEECWISDDENLGVIKTYVKDSELLVVGNGSGKIMANEDSSFMFATYQNLQEINGLEMFDTSKVTDMRGMFQACNALNELNISNWNTSKVTDMRGMFQGCISLEELNVSSWDTSKVIHMNDMFESCENLRSLDLLNWRTGNVKTMGRMFSGCSSLVRLEIANWDTSNVTYMRNMFSYCGNITELDVLNWDVSKVEDMSYMFYGCTNLDEIDISNWNINSTANKDNMFSSNY